LTFQKIAYALRQSLQGSRIFVVESLQKDHVIITTIYADHDSARQTLFGTFGLNKKGDYELIETDLRILEASKKSFSASTGICSHSRKVHASDLTLTT
jgi:hypothetical protein